MNDIQKNTGAKRVHLVLAIAAAIVLLCAGAFFQFNTDGSDPVATVETSLLEPGDFSVTKVRAPVVQRKAEPAPIRRKTALPYDPDSPLASQLQALRNLSDQGDPYSTCVLAWALDFCARGPDRISVAEYVNVDPDSLDDRSVDRIAKSFEFREQYATTCIGLDSGSFADIDERLLQSAKMGHARSMTKLALLPFRLGNGEETSNPEFVLAYRKNAELMLNRAAEAGDLEAIRGVYQAYGLGYITSAMGTLAVEKDLVKSTAALRAMSLYAGPEEKEGLEQNIASAMRGMSRADISRMQRLEFSYFHPGRSNSAVWADDKEVIEDFPEKACASDSGTSTRLLSSR